MTKHDETTVSYYAEPGPMTDTTACPTRIFDGLPTEPDALARTVQGLIVHEMWAHAYGLDVPESRLTDLQARSAREMTDLIQGLHAGPLAVERPVEQRMIGNCRHFSTLSCALLRRAGVPARARCGFAAYFEAGKYVDHWVTEYWHADEGRWVRIDVQLDAVQRAAIEPDFDTEDLPAGPFLPAGEAWQQCRAGHDDPGRFGIFDMWGLWFIQGNVIRDLAALNKMELLPWDVWGPMTYNADPDEAGLTFTDTVAGTLVADDVDAIRHAYETDSGLRVPDKVFDARFEVEHPVA
jgi:Transglutaminase-like superfamily